MTDEKILATSRKIPKLRIYVYPNRPRRSKSRWRKKLDKQFRPHKIMEASRCLPFMKVLWRPKNEEEAKKIRERVILSYAMTGMAVALPPDADKLRRMLEGYDAG